MSGRIRVENWEEALQPLLVNQHPLSDGAHHLEVPLMDIYASLKFSVKWKRTLDKAIDFLIRAYEDYLFLEAALAYYSEAAEELKKSAAALNRFVQVVDWRDNELGLNLDPTLLASLLTRTSKRALLSSRIVKHTR